VTFVIFDTLIVRPINIYTCHLASLFVCDLQQGVIRDEKDLQLLGERFQQAYAKPRNDPFAQSHVII